MNLIETIATLDVEKKQKLIRRIKSNGEEYGIYPLTANQNSIWCKYKAMEHKNQYSNPCFRLSIKHISEEKLLHVIKTLFTLHDVFKYKYVEMEEEVYQYFDKEAQLPLVKKDLTSDVSASNIALMEKQFFDIPFRLDQNVPVRFEVLKLSDDEFLLLICIHHIICDGWSVGNILRDIYRLIDGNVPEINYNFGHYAMEKCSPAGIRKQKEDEAYWIEKIANVDKFLDLPVDFDRAVKNTSEAGTIELVIEEADYNNIMKLVKETKSNTYVVLSSLFSILLQEWSGKKKIILASTFFNRNDEKLCNVVGDFASVVPFVFEFENRLTIAEYIRKNMSFFIEAVDHDDVVFHRIADAYSNDKIENVFPIYQACMVYHSKNLLGGDADVSSGIEITVKDLADEGNMDDFLFDLCMKVIDYNDKFVITIQYAKNLYRRETMKDILLLYGNMIKNIEQIKDVEMKKLNLASLSDGDMQFSSHIDSFVKYEPVKLNIEKCFTYEAGSNYICILNENRNPVPRNFYGEIFIREKEQWYSTGKIGRIQSDATLEIRDDKSYILWHNEDIVNIRKAILELETYYEGAKFEFVLLDAGKLVLNYENTTGLLDIDAIEKVISFKPDLLYKKCALSNKKRMVHQKDIFLALGKVISNGYDAIVIQEHSSDNVNIVFSGSSAAKVSLIEEIELSVKNEKIGFKYSSTPVSVLEPAQYSFYDFFEYPKRNKSNTEKKMLEIWQEILHSDDFGIYDNFYEVGGDSVKVILLMNRVNTVFSTDIKITDLFVYNTISELAGYVDELLGADLPVQQKVDILSF